MSPSQGGPSSLKRFACVFLFLKFLLNLYKGNINNFRDKKAGNKFKFKVISGTREHNIFCHCSPVPQNPWEGLLDGFWPGKKQIIIERKEEFYHNCFTISHNLIGKFAVVNNSLNNADGVTHQFVTQYNSQSGMLILGYKPIILQENYRQCLHDHMLA